MVTGHGMVIMAWLKNFIRDIPSLRELILDSESLSITDAALTTTQADTLELLSLGWSHEHSQVPHLPVSQICTMFSTLTALRHLHLCIQSCAIVGTNGSITSSNEVLREILVS
jgi:hypothetical protein